MVQINEHFLKLKAGYLFPEIARRVAKFCEKYPQADVIRLGIGDVTEPLPEAVIEALHVAVDEEGVHAARVPAPRGGCHGVNMCCNHARQIHLGKIRIRVAIRDPVRTGTIGRHPRKNDRRACMGGPKPAPNIVLGSG